MKTKLINRILGFSRDRDEFQYQEIYRILGNTGMWLWCISMVYMFVRLFFINYQQASPSIDYFFILVLNLTYAGVITIRLRVSKVDIEEIYSYQDYMIIKKKIKWQAVFMGITWGLQMFTLMGLFDFLYTGTYTYGFIHLTIWLCGGALFGTFMYFSGKSKLTIVE
ncbi:DUF3278 domain-containing protein [Amphibacillus jilinensis]|uniref:DUF3278 domain-containing protein n=1 Tax=Amphibacillus jilinensis TaxID=1216008 RepID=UPI0002FD6899|nr:DUF3278 domain-containing protein [Amphibacillus jilinensis]